MQLSPQTKKDFLTSLTIEELEKELETRGLVAVPTIRHGDVLVGPVRGFNFGQIVLPKGELVHLSKSQFKAMAEACDEVVRNLKE